MPEGVRSYGDAFVRTTDAQPASAASCEDGDTGSQRLDIGWRRPSDSRGRRKFQRWIDPDVAGLTVSIGMHYEIIDVPDRDGAVSFRRVESGCTDR